jgi:hypothetical protein
MDLNTSHTLGCAGRTHNPSGHVQGGTRPGQTRQKPKDLRVFDREERGRGSVVLCVRGNDDDYEENVCVYLQLHNKRRKTRVKNVT